MIFVDPRTGSKELMPLFLQQQIAFESQSLEFGDCAFIGSGPDGPAFIGIERKGIRDLASSLMSQRLVGHQLPGLLRSYHFSWLVVEGSWRVNTDTGFVEVPRQREWVTLEPRFTGDTLENWLLTLELRGGVRVRLTYNPADTARFVGALHTWWTKKDWQDHRSHLALYTPPDAAILDLPSLTRRWAFALPGIGMERAKDVEAAFKTPIALAMAEEAAWRAIPGVGETIAARVMEAIHGVAPLRSGNVRSVTRVK